MAVAVIMPKVGITVENCVITKWHKAKGDAVKKGELLFSYETDKSSMDEEAGDSGTLLDIFFGEGEDVPCLQNVCVIGEPGEDTSPYQPVKPGKTDGAEVSAQKGPPAEDKPDATGSAGQFVRISPRAKAFAEKAGVDFRLATPTGADGRITETDVRSLIGNAQSASPAVMVAEREQAAPEKQIKSGAAGSFDISEAFPSLAPDYEEFPLSNIRKTIAKAMAESLRSMAQLTLQTSFDASELLSFRRKLKESGEALGMGNITVNDIVVYVVSRTLLRHKMLNANLVNDSLRLFKNVHMGVAVDTEKGLLVPTLFNANTKSLSQIAKEAKELALSCREGRIGPDALAGGTFTVTNLGTLEIEAFTPVINPPQTAILGVGSIVTRVRDIDGELKPYPSMGLSLTFDHRAMDGGTAGRFMKELKGSLECFSLLLAR